MGVPFTIDAIRLTNWQKCRRRFILENQWRYLKWLPKSLFDSCLRQAIYEFSNGEEIDAAKSKARTRFLNTAANPGLELGYDGVDPYKLAMDYCGMMDNILEAYSRKTIPVLKDIPSVMIADDLEFTFTSHQDDMGELHRFVSTSRLDDDFITKEMHSWPVFLETALTKQILHLHIFQIGQKRDGRIHSEWTKAYAHDYIRGKIKFTKKGGKELEGKWSPVMFSDQDTYSSSAWVDRLEEEGLTDKLITHLEIDVPKQQHIHEAIRQVKTEAEQMQTWLQQIENPRLVPMSRPACDGISPCPFRAVCYSPDVTMDIQGLGLYKRKT